jgi:hypothetical protein
VQVSRRRFLKLSAATIAAAAALAVAGKWSYAPIQRWMYRLPTDVPPGPLTQPSQRTMMAVVDTLIGARFEPSHYEEYFSFYAQTVSGYRGLYERAAAMLDGAAARLGADNFAGLGFEARRAIVDSTLAALDTRVGRLWTAVRQRDAVLFERHIVGPVLAMYRETDAWVHLGYRQWRGQPRGLVNYTRAPQAHAGSRRQGG